MAKIIVDQGLAETIRSIRTQNNIQAKDLASELGKSRSYVSKLENGGIATIDSDELFKCLKFISKETELDEILDRVFKTVSIIFTQKERERMLWLDNFDMVYRIIPIPKEYSKHYSEILKENDITVEELADAINQNIFIPREILKKPNIPIEQWFGDGENTYIKMYITPQEIDDILTGRQEKSNYVRLLAIVLYTLRLTEYKETDVIDIIQSDEIRVRARDTLECYKIYTLLRKTEIVERAANAQEIYERLSKHDLDNVKIMNRFNPLLSLYSYYDIASANRLIDEFTKNMEWDAPFVMEIAGLPFYKLEHCSFRLKSELLEKIQNLLSEMLELPDEEKKREEYRSFSAKGHKE